MHGALCMAHGSQSTNHVLHTCAPHTPAPQAALGSLLALMAAQPKAVRVAYRARYWACALDILELTATASAREAAAAAGKSGGLPLADHHEGAAASWCDWSQQLMTTHKDCFAYSDGVFTTPL